MRTRVLVALVLMALGVVLIAFAILSVLIRSAPFANVPILAAAGALLLVIGLLLLITELMENWLTKGQAALVDGLQAG
ncbi:MAG: hypothetical protein ABSC50_11705 [Candidatus Bathyarchaeia archaeon]